jgi:hypothetical protein
LQKKKELILVVVVVATRGKFKISFFFSFSFFFLIAFGRKNFLFPPVRVLRPILACVSSSYPLCVRLQQQLAAAAAAAAATQRPPTLSPSLASVLSRNSQSTVSGSNQKREK